jgi:predicted AAA+ superfamily ATPase
LISPKSYEYGKYFESFFIQEVHRQLSYSERNFRLSHLRIDNSQEIDLIVEFSGKPAFLVEIKSSKHVDERTARTLNQLGHEFPQAQKIVASQDPEPKRFQDVDALHWLEAIRKITC